MRSAAFCGLFLQESRQPPFVSCCVKDCMPVSAWLVAIRDSKAWLKGLPDIDGQFPVSRLTEHLGLFPTSSSLALILQRDSRILLHLDVVLTSEIRSRV